MKILLARPTPRGNIEKVERHNMQLQCDKLHVMYHKEPEAYEIIQDYFLTHDYDYLIIAPDDLMVTNEHLNILKEDLKLNYDIIGGIANVDEGDDNISSCLTVHDILNGPIWIKRDKLPKDDIFKVAFNGFALMAIHKRVFEKVKFKSTQDDIYDGKSYTGSVDTLFCIDCHKNNINIHTDKRIDMIHFRKQGIFRVGTREPMVIFEAY